MLRLDLAANTTQAGRHHIEDRRWELELVAAARP
jgi:hypothetical protein